MRHCWIEKNTIHWLSCALSFIHSACHFFLSSLCLQVAANWEWGQPFLIYLTKRERQADACHIDRQRDRDKWRAAPLLKLSLHYISHNRQNVSTYQLLSLSNSFMVTLMIKERLESDQWWFPAFHHLEQTHDKFIGLFLLIMEICECMRACVCKGEASLRKSHHSKNF